MKRSSDLKFKLYETAVQSPQWQMHELPRFHKLFTGRVPLSMREDFCGTAKISCEWVKKSPKHRAVGLDLDPETLEYGKRVNVGGLTEVQSGRVQLLKQNVLKPTREKFDVIGSHNFSFFVFHERKELLQYAKSALKSLKKGGTFFMEMAGGPGFIQEDSSSEKMKVPGVGRVDYVWETHQYDAVTKVCDYSIHFKLPGGKWMNDAFRYHWRLWEIREVREVLLEAGFKSTKVLLPKDDTMTRYEAVETETGSDVWLAYVVGIR